MLLGNLSGAGIALFRFCQDPLHRHFAAELQRQIDAKKADLDRVGAKVTQFDGGKIEAEIAELTDIAVELKIIEAPVVAEEVAVEEAVPTAEAVDQTQADEVNQEEVAAPVSLSDLL